MSDRADCSQCLFALYKDEGYSVYTVLGTDIIVDVDCVSHDLRKSLKVFL